MVFIKGRIEKELDTPLVETQAVAIKQLIYGGREGEFIAYYYMFTVRGLPAVNMKLPGDRGQINAEKQVVKGYFDAIDPKRKGMYQKQFEELDRLFDDLLKQ